MLLTDTVDFEILKKRLGVLLSWESDSRLSGGPGSLFRYIPPKFAFYPAIVSMPLHVSSRVDIVDAA